MEPKQILVEQLVIDYFQQRPDTEVRFSADGSCKVSLNSAKAQQAFFGNRELILLFDPLQAIEVQDGELISATHPILEVIRNDLKSDTTIDLRITEAHVILQPLDQDGGVTIPNLYFHDTRQLISYKQSFIPLFVFTYQVVYDTDERSENLLRLSYNACTGELKPEILTHLETILLEEGSPAQDRAPKQLSLEELLKNGRQEIEKRIYSDLQNVEHQISERLSADKIRLTKHLEAEIAELRSSNVFERQQLEERLKKDIGELEQKYFCHVRVRLLSILRLWWPELSYNITFSSTRGDYKITDISYNLIEGKPEFPSCSICGNDSVFDVCTAGHHTSCGGDCHEEIHNCAVCLDSICSSHGSACAHCGKFVCYRDREHCDYGSHLSSDYFCPDCAKESFEGKPVCLDCLEVCTSCGRNFAHKHLQSCRIDNKHVCVEGSEPCGFICQECSQISCKIHGIVTAEKTWVCIDHFEKSTCCNEIYGRSRLVKCVIVDRELLCPNTEHRSTCQDCQNAVCFDHSLPLTRHRGKRVCQNCRVGCDLCPPTRHYLRNDLAQCKTCKKLVCADHRSVCAVCGRTVCIEHLIVSVTGESLCRDDAGICAHCQKGANVHRKNELISCQLCGQYHCLSHDMICQTCGKTHFCKLHLSNLQMCESCGRASCQVDGCTTTKYKCPDCGLIYCQNCFIQGRCKTCASLKAVLEKTLSQNGHAWLAQTVRPNADQSGLELIDGMLRYEAKHTNFRSSQNNTYIVYILHSSPPGLQRLFKGDWSIANKQLRIVVRSSNKEIVRIKVENKQS
jgi:hypothetical protein